jgi:hypothetical protein
MESIKYFSVPKQESFPNGSSNKGRGNSYSLLQLNSLKTFWGKSRKVRFGDRHLAKTFEVRGSRLEAITKS